MMKVNFVLFRYRCPIEMIFWRLRLEINLYIIPQGFECIYFGRVHFIVQENCYKR